MTESESSRDINRTGFQEYNYPLDKDWFDINMSDLILSSDISPEDERPLAQLEKVAIRLVSNQVEEKTPSIVPLLGYLVPGAESCALFRSDPVNRQLVPMAVANLSRDSVFALSNGDGERLLSIAKQAEPYLIVNLPDDERFNYMSELFQKEGIRTIWLIPCRESDGNLTGAFLFASKSVFSPGKEAIVSVTILSAWMSAMIRQAGNARSDDRFKAGINNDGNFLKAKVIKEEQTADINNFIRDFSRSQQDGESNAGNTVPGTYRDKDGLPVMYDSATQAQRNQTKTDNISVLWHELLSPLTVIKGYTSTLLQLNDAITEEQKEQYIRGIDSASNRVIRLLENLRDATRLEESGTIAAHPIYLYELLRITVSEMQSQTTKHIIKLRPCARLPRIKVDPEKIEQVITNLLVNATKYSPQGGDIEAEIHMVRGEQEMRRMFGDTPPVKLPCQVVSISDHGIGVPESELNRIFERFYRVKTKLTRATPGVGLGLYISKVIVEAHGGNIWARNRLQGGSTFSFSLPFDE